MGERNLRRVGPTWARGQGKFQRREPGLKKEEGSREVSFHSTESEAEEWGESMDEIDPVLCTGDVGALAGH